MPLPPARFERGFPLRRLVGRTRLPVILQRAWRAGSSPSFDRWVSIDPDAPYGLDPARMQPRLSALLEEAFSEEAATWWAMGRELSQSRSAALAHTPACVANASDFGLMLAWVRLVRQWAAAPATTLVLCSDPWVFRELRSIPGVTPTRAPILAVPALLLRIRGHMARLSASVRFGRSAILLRRLRQAAPKHGAALLVYGHPASLAAGSDGYFGNLMQTQATLHRVLHVDCGPDRAQAIAKDGRTDSLHGFGSPLFAAKLLFARWRPSLEQRRGPHGWLVRRAAAREGSTAQAAAILWQLHCQERWLQRRRPAVVTWPWENHSWERVFVRVARRLGVRTIGYQHSVIGQQMLNYAPASNPDGEASLPDRIFCSGAATRNQLVQWGIDPRRLMVAGALRYARKTGPSWDPSAPVFVALPFDSFVAREMVDAARRCAAAGLKFVVKDHPMTPFAFEESEGVSRTKLPLPEHTAVSAVVYAATTVGLEAILAGLPTLRFQPQGRIALDILPGSIRIPTTDSHTLKESLADLRKPDSVDIAHVFAPVDEAVWREALDSMDARTG